MFVIISKKLTFMGYTFFLFLFTWLLIFLNKNWQDKSNGNHGNQKTFPWVHCHFLVLLWLFVFVTIQETFHRECIFLTSYCWILCLVSLSPHDWTEISLNASKNKFPHFCSVNVMGHTFIALEDLNPALIYISILLRALRSTSWEIKAFWSLSWSCAQHWTCKWPSIFPGIY